jgi:hypothetical protein
METIIKLQLPLLIAVTDFMINKRYLAVFLAVGLIVSIGCVVSQEKPSNQPKQDAIAQEKASAAPSAVPAASQVSRQFNVDRYSITYPSGPLSPNDGIAVVSLFYGSQPVGVVTFVKDDAMIKQAEFDANNSKIALYYPFSRLGSILNLLERYAPVTITYRTGPSGVSYGGMSVQGISQSTQGAIQSTKS